MMKSDIEVCQGESKVSSCVVKCWPLFEVFLESIKKDQAAWSQLAKLDPFALNADEFLAFTHPESSVAHHLEMVEEMYEKFDKDGDELLTEDEFSIFHPEGI